MSAALLETLNLLGMVAVVLTYCYINLWRTRGIEQ